MSSPSPARFVDVLTRALISGLRAGSAIPGIWGRGNFDAALAARSSRPVELQWSLMKLPRDWSKARGRAAARPRCQMLGAGSLLVAGSSSPVSGMSSIS